jgi:hypothetical protein
MIIFWDTHHIVGLVKRLKEPSPPSSPFARLPKSSMQIRVCLSSAQGSL